MRESHSTTLTAATVEQMRAVGAALGIALQSVSGPIVVAIRGELGAGKTTLVGGLLNSLGLVGPARSPTYTLIEPYELGRRAIHHLDLYRLVDPSEVEALGVRDLLVDRAVLLIEWPEQGGDFVPPADIGIAILYSNAPASGREVTISTHSPAGEQLLAAFGGATKL